MEKKYSMDVTKALYIGVGAIAGSLLSSPDALPGSAGRAERGSPPELSTLLA